MYGYSFELQIYNENESKEAFERGADLWCLDLAEEGFTYNPETKTYTRES